MLVAAESRHSRLVRFSSSSRIGPLIACSLAAVACANSGDRHTVPGVTPSSIALGTHQPLSGPAAPGQDEVATAAKAYFDYVNAHGGVHGRKLTLAIDNDADDPAQTVADVEQLVDQQRVFAIFQGLGTTTHEAVVRFLNAMRVPDVFVGSGCSCWGNGHELPYTFGWQPSYTIEGKILGHYIERHLPGQEVAVLYEDDDFGLEGLAGIEDEIPAREIVSRQGYQPGATTLTPQITAIQHAHARVMIDFTLPIYTALAQWTASTLGYRPKLVVSSDGIDPYTVTRLLKLVSGGKATGTALIDGAVTDAYLPPAADESNPWVRLFMRIRAEYDPNAPWDENVEYGMASAYTLVQALIATGRDLTRRGLIRTIDTRGHAWGGPALVGYRYTRGDHSGLVGAELGQVQGDGIVLFGGPLTTGPTASSPVVPYRRGQPDPPASGIPSN
jgi:branched-chain amino acid transport system substrate-binding protein